MRPDGDRSGPVEHLQLCFALGQRLCATQDWPRWNDGGELEAVREAAPAGTRQ